MLSQAHQVLRTSKELSIRYDMRPVVSSLDFCFKWLTYGVGPYAYARCICRGFFCLYAYVFWKKKHMQHSNTLYKRPVIDLLWTGCYICFINCITFLNKTYLQHCECMVECSWGVESLRVWEVRVESWVLKSHSIVQNSELLTCWLPIMAYVYF